MAAAPLSGAAEAVGLFSGSGIATAVGPTDAVLTAGGSTLAAAVGGGALLALAAKKLAADKAPTLELAAEAATGAIFAVGLGVAGMTRPSRVIAFLAAPLVAATGKGGSVVWDPTLGLTMVGALLFAAPAIQFLLRKAKGTLLGAPVDMPTSTAVDRKLVAGSLLFGAGWGVGGICPGPGLVATMGAAARAPYAAWSAAFMVAHALTTKALDA